MRPQMVLNRCGFDGNIVAGKIAPLGIQIIAIVRKDVPATSRHCCSQMMGGLAHPCSDHFGHAIAFC